jgi:hypothetical protein
MVGLLSGIVGWVVSFTSLGTAVVRSARDVGVAALVAIVLTATIILLGNGHGWKVSEPDSWIHFAVFFVVPLTLAGVAALRRRKAAR